MPVLNLLRIRWWVVLCLLLLTACGQEKSPVYSIGTGGLTGTYETVGVALRRILSMDPETRHMRFEDRLSAGSAANIQSLAKGEIQFGIGQADHLYQAVNGTGDFASDGPQQKLRAVFNLYTESVALVAGGDTRIMSMQDLLGKRVDIGAPGSGTRNNAIAALRAAGFDWQKDIVASGSESEVRLEKFMAGEIDAYFYTAGHPNQEIKFASFSVRGIRLVPLENIPALLESGSFYSAATIPAGTYERAGSGDIETVGVNAILLTSADVSEDLVYSMTKAVFKNIDVSAEFSKEFGALFDRRYFEGVSAPLHPGAARYFREIGIPIP